MDVSLRAQGTYRPTFFKADTARAVLPRGSKNSTPYVLRCGRGGDDFGRGFNSRPGYGMGSNPPHCRDRSPGRQFLHVLLTDGTHTKNILKDGLQGSPDHGERRLHAIEPLDVVVPRLSLEQIYREDKGAGHGGGARCRRGSRRLHPPALQQEEARGGHCQEERADLHVR